MHRSEGLPVFSFVTALSIGVWVLGLGGFRISILVCMDPARRQGTVDFSLSKTFICIIYFVEVF